MNNQYPQGPQGHGQPQGFAPPAGYGAAPTSGYEFSGVENKTIGRCATWAKAVGILFFVQAGLAVLDFNIVSIAIDLAIGLAMWKGGKALQSVVETQGNDVFQMMEALNQLSSAFTIRLVIVGIAFGIMAIAGIAVVALGVSF